MVARELIHGRPIKVEQTMHSGDVIQFVIILSQGEHLQRLWHAWKVREENALLISTIIRSIPRPAGGGSIQTFIDCFQTAYNSERRKLLFSSYQL